MNEILQEFHTSPIGGQAGITRTVARICSQFFWPKMKQVITEFVKLCSVCQQAKHSTSLPYGLVSPLPIPMQVYEDLAMDFIIGLPTLVGLLSFLWWLIVGVIVSESIQKQNRKPNQFKPKTTKIAFDLDEFGGFFC